jgi:hypothetical protein
MKTVQEPEPRHVSGCLEQGGGAGEGLGPEGGANPLGAPVVNVCVPRLHHFND